MTLIIRRGWRLNQVSSRTLYQHTHINTVSLSTHPINTPLNPPYQPTLSTALGFVERTECGTNTTFGCAYGQLGEIDPFALFVKFVVDLFFLR